MVMTDKRQRTKCLEDGDGDTHTARVHMMYFAVTATAKRTILL